MKRFLAVMVFIGMAATAMADPTADLFAAIAKADLAGVNKALAAGADANGRDAYGYSPLNLALFRIKAKAWEPIARALIAKGADTIQLMGPETTLLSIAIDNGLADRVTLLLGAGVDPRPEANDGFYSLNYAAERGLPAIIPALIAKGCDPNGRDPKRGGCSPIYWAGAGYCGAEPSRKPAYLEAARLLFAAGADPNLANDKGLTAFGMLITQKADETIASLFLEHGADPLATGDHGETILMRQPLMPGKENLAFFKRLVDAGADPRAVSPYMGCALSSAVKAKRVETVKYLISLGVDLDAADQLGWRPLHFITGKDYEIARLLLAAGADPNAPAWDSCTPLMWQIMPDRGAAFTLDLAKLFLDYGASLSAFDGQGNTALHYAAHMGFFRTMELFLSKGAKVDATAEWGAGLTPFLYVCLVGPDDPEVLKALVKAGADPRRISSEGLGAAECATRGGNKRILAYLAGLGIAP